METLNYLAMGLLHALEPSNLFYCFLGVLLGTLIGVLPGIGPAGALALLLPITFSAPALSTIIMLGGIVYGAMYGGSTTSILVNIPGEAASIVTCLDGYQMARKGRAGPALGIAAFGSFIAGTLSLFGLVFVVPPLGEFGLRFGPPEYFAIMTFALSTLVYLARGSMAKSLTMAAFGFILASVGLDPMIAQPRFIHNVFALRDGFDMVQLVIGVFGVSEILISLEKEVGTEVLKTEIKGLLPNLQDWKDSIFPITRGSILGFFMGILPGIGATVPTFISYIMEKRISKHPEKFGAGAIQGVAAPEACNNAASNGAWIPLLSLGIPTGAISALLFGALMIHGITPGPMFIKESPEVFWGLIGSMYIGNVMLLILNLPLIAIWVRALQIPYYILSLLILLLCMIGSYTANNSSTDILIMVIFGLVGYLMKKFDYEPAPLVMGFVLGPMVEKNLRLSMTMFHGNFLTFFHRPIPTVFLCLSLLILISPILFKKRFEEVS